jgi:multicomponent Na+:H+ antiporter subunit E
LLRAVSLGIALFAFWVLLSGFFTPFLLSMGVASAAAVVWFTHRMDVVDHEGHPIRLSGLGLGYWAWLLKEIVKSAWDVARIVVNPRLPISPTIIDVDTSQKTDVGVATYANSITLTPGTISVDVEPKRIRVHALTRSAAEGLAEGEMDRRVTRMEGGG